MIIEVNLISELEEEVHFTVIFNILALTSSSTAAPLFVLVPLLSSFFLLTQEFNSRARVE